MTTREIPKATWDGESIISNTLYYRYPEGSNILGRGLYKNLFIIEEGSGLTPDDASALAEFMIYNGDYYYRDNNEWIKIILGPIPVRYNNIYLKSEQDALIDALDFDDTQIIWDNLTEEEQEAYLVGRVN